MRPTPLETVGLSTKVTAGLYPVSCSPSILIVVLDSSAWKDMSVEHVEMVRVTTGNVEMARDV